MARVMERFIERYNEDAMLYCEECGRFVAPEDLVTRDESIYHSEVDTRCYERIRSSHCPYCDSEDIDDAWLCEECGEVWLSPDEATVHDGLCDDCRREIYGEV